MPPSTAGSDVAGTPYRRGQKVYFAGTLLAQVCALVRYTLLARLLGPEQLGLAATVILTQQFFDSISDSGTDRFVIQDKEGDSVRVQQMLQAVMLGRGTFTALALVLLSAPIAAFYSAPALRPALMMLALSPLIAGAVHLDLRRRQRHHDFRIEGVALLLGESLSLLATVIAAYVVRDFTAVLYGLITRSIVFVAVSHWRAERRYKIGYSREYGPRLARFAAPLMLNGLFFFVGSQGDRLLIANRLGLAELGHYSAVILLILNPAALLSRYMITMNLPRIAAGRDDPAQGEKADAAFGGLTLLLGLSMCVGFAVVAPVMVVVLYGQRFSLPAVVICLIGILQTSRFMRQWPSTGALGVGRSGIVMADNLSRLIGLPAAIVGIQLVGGLVGATAGFISGEMIALATTKFLLNRAKGLPILYGFDRIAMFILASGAVFAWAWTLQRPSLVGLALCAIGSAVLAVRLVFSESETIHQVLKISSGPVHRLRRRLGCRDRASLPAAPSPAATDAENRLV